MPLPEFYAELVKTQQVLNKKHLGWAALRSTARLAAGHLMRGQTNFVKMLWKFNSVYNPKLQMADHQRPVSYEMSLPPSAQETVNSKLSLHSPGKRTASPCRRRFNRAVHRNHPNGEQPLAVVLLGPHAVDPPVD